MIVTAFSVASFNRWVCLRVVSVLQVRVHPAQYTMCRHLCCMKLVLCPVSHLWESDMSLSGLAVYLTLNRR